MANCYAFRGKNEEEASDGLTTIIILVYDRIANVLFDPISTYSYVFMRFDSKFYIIL